MTIVEYNNANVIQGLKTEHQAVTKAKCNKGFSGNSSILPRSNFGVSGQESSPQSLTVFSLNRYGQGSTREYNFNYEEDIHIYCIDSDCMH
jgi:hypothetical protein